MTVKKTNRQKTSAAFGRAFKQAGVPSIPAVVRANWRNIVMPWRMIPQPVAFALIGLVALAMVLDMGAEASTIGGTSVPTDMDCAEDTVIAFTGVDTLDCVHFENIPASYGTVTLTLGDYVPGESPCVEDEIYDTVAVECIHIDRVAPRHTAQPTATATASPTMTPTSTPTSTP